MRKQSNLQHHNSILFLSCGIACIFLFPFFPLQNFPFTSLLIKCIISSPILAFVILLLRKQCYFLRKMKCLTVFENMLKQFKWYLITLIQIKNIPLYFSITNYHSFKPYQKQLTIKALNQLFIFFSLIYVYAFISIWFVPSVPIIFAPFIILLILFMTQCLDIFLCASVYNFRYMLAEKDKYFWLKVWNYLSCIADAETRWKSNKTYCTVREMNQKNRINVTLNDIMQAKMTLNKLHDNEVASLVAAASTQIVDNNFNTGNNSIEKYTALITSIIATVATALEIISKLISFNLAFSLDDFLHWSDTHKFNLLFFLYMLLIFIFCSAICFMVYGYFTFRKKRKQIQPILFNLLDQELERRKRK